MSNTVLEYIAETVDLLYKDDKKGLEALNEAGRDKYVTLEDVGNALLTLVNDLTQYTNTSQAITEVRMKALVYSLPEDVQEQIFKKFEEAEDDLFTLEGEEINYE